jgi:ribosomal protein S19
MLAVMVSLSTSQPMSKIKERKATLNPDFIGKPFSTVNGYDYLSLSRYVNKYSTTQPSDYSINYCSD